MKIRDVEVEFDFLDADDMERFEKEAQRVKDESETKSKEECMIINKFFDNVFGKGISEKLFKGKMNLGEHIKAFEDIVKEKIEQQTELQNTLNRYQPNREQRRYNQYKGKR